MPVKDAEITVTEEEEACRHCGHLHLITSARDRGSHSVWFAFCPACGRVQESARIPEWFLRGLPPPPPPTERLH